MDAFKISVIVPVYGAENYLHRCVDSILAQTYGDFEVILVDDGAKDQSPVICDEYAGKDSRVKAIHKENGGLISAWMRGVRESEGQYLCFVDSDDWIENTMFEEMVSHLDGVTGEIVCGSLLIDRNGRTTPECNKLPCGIYEGNSLEAVKKNLLGNEEREIMMSRCTKLFSRELIENNMQLCNPVIRMGEDVNIVLPALLDAKRVVILEGALHYHYMYNEDSMVHRYDTGLYENLKLLYETICLIYEEKNMENGASQARREFFYLLLLALKNELRSNQSGYTERIRAICMENRTKQVLKEENIRMTRKSNQLLALIMRYPNTFVIRCVKAAIDLFDRVK